MTPERIQATSHTGRLEGKTVIIAALFLISDEASFVTGSAMIVDGGNSINKT